MAGVKVAHRLLKADISVTILEISDYIGGRMKCTQFNNQTIEEGANWIQGLVNKEHTKYSEREIVAKYKSTEEILLSDSQVNKSPINTLTRVPLIKGDTVTFSLEMEDLLSEDSMVQNLFKKVNETYFVYIFLDLKLNI